MLTVMAETVPVLEMPATTVTILNKRTKADQRGYPMAHTVTCPNIAMPEDMVLFMPGLLTYVLCATIKWYCRPHYLHASALFS